jgi:hypothetical protein
MHTIRNCPRPSSTSVRASARVEEVMDVHGRTDGRTQAVHVHARSSAPEEEENKKREIPAAS